MSIRRPFVAAVAVPLVMGVIGVGPSAVGAAVSPTVVVASSVNPSAMGQTVTFRARVALAGTATSAISGTATFTIDGVVAGTATVTSGVGSFSTRALHVGPHAIAASFVGAGGSAVSPTLTQTVTMGSTTTSIVSSRPTANYGDAGSITATVKAVAPAAGVPTGSVDFAIDGRYYWTSPLDTTGHARLALADVYPGFGPGAHTVTAAYLGDGDYAPSATPTAITQTLVGLSVAPVTTLTIGAGGLPVFSIRSFTLRSADPVGCTVTITNSTPTTQSLVYGTPGAWKRLPFGAVAPGGSIGVGVGIAPYTGYFATSANPANYVAIRCT